MLTPRRGAERDFLPAALEIVESPPSPLPRLVAGVIIAFFCAALAWAWFGRVDIIATARGRILPDGRVKVVQPLEIGTVTAIAVEEGQHVTAGQMLIDIDPTLHLADRDRFAADLTRARLDIARLQAQIGGGGGPFAAPAEAPPALVAVARARLAAQEAEQQAKLAVVERQLAEKRAESGRIRAQIDKLEAALPLVGQRAAIRRAALASGFGSRIALLEAQQCVVEQRSELTAERRHLEEIQQAMAALGHLHDQTAAEYRHGLLAELAKAEEQADALTQELRKAAARAARQRLIAPVDGTVHQLAVHTIGGVVTPAQPLLEIVPGNASLEIEAMVENKDIGFVAVGQPAEIKVEAFDFTRYGLLPGHVTGLSPDAVPPDRILAPPAATPATMPSPSPSASPPPVPAQPAYLARIALDRGTMPVEGREIPLEAGMAVSVEIRTGRRRVLDYLLSPLRRYGHDGLRER